MSARDILIKSNVADHCKFYGTTEGTVFDVELRRNEKYSVFSIKLIAVSWQLTAINNFLCVLCG
jgi:hypothetical protein